jgi:hypothetical protein
MAGHVVADVVIVMVKVSVMVMVVVVLATGLVVVLLKAHVVVVSRVGHKLPAVEMMVTLVVQDLLGSKVMVVVVSSEPVGCAAGTDPRKVGLCPRNRESRHATCESEEETCALNP